MGWTGTGVEGISEYQGSRGHLEAQSPQRQNSPLISYMSKGIEPTALHSELLPQCRIIPSSDSINSRSNPGDLTQGCRGTPHFTCGTNRLHLLHRVMKPGSPLVYLICSQHQQGQDTREKEEQWAGVPRPTEPWSWVPQIPEAQGRQQGWGGTWVHSKLSELVCDLKLLQGPWVTPIPPLPWHESLHVQPTLAWPQSDARNDRRGMRRVGVTGSVLGHSAGRPRPPPWAQPHAPHDSA